MFNAITRIQRRAAPIITGAYRTTAGPAVDVEVHLLPVPQQLDTKHARSDHANRNNAYAAMALCQDDNRIPSPLDRFSSILERKYSIQLDQLEKGQPRVVPAWWTPPLIHIADAPDMPSKNITFPILMCSVSIPMEVASMVTSALLR